MILLVRRRTITILVLAAIAFSFGMSVLAFLVLQTFGELTPAEQKVVAERVLLVGVVGTILVCAGLLLVVRDAVNLSAVFKRLAGMHRMSGDQIHAELRGLGVVGDQIGTLYTSINSLSARKSTRIAALDALLNTVLNRTDANLLIVNAAGTVYRATPAALRHLDASSGEVVDHSIDDFVDAERFSETSATVARRRGSHMIGEGRTAMVVLPVTNDQGLIAYYVYLLGEDARDELKRNPPKRQPARSGHPAQPGGTNAAGEAPSPVTVADGARSDAPNPIRALLRRFTFKRK